jgi:spore germination protein
MGIQHNSWLKGALAAALAVASITGLYGCSRGSAYSDGGGAMAGRSPSPSAVQAESAPAELSAWLADWDWKLGFADLRQVAEGLTSLQLFAAYFDSEDQPFLTEEFQAGWEELNKQYPPNKRKPLYITLVNDSFLKDGSTVQKDSTLLTRLLATADTRSSHIEDIVSLANKYDFQGVELDYERVADGDWSGMLLLIAELHERLQAEQLKLRVVLEPGAPFHKFDLPEGPEYGVMAYNLYGYHSGPGPKADHAFITKLTQKAAALPGDPYIAFSGGGFDWGPKGSIKALTEAQAVKLAEQTGSKLQRDAASGGAYFTYTDKKRGEHTVWYADAETMAGWMETARAGGSRKMALWRLGELSAPTLAFLKGYVDSL